jgi:uracil-DNA glycosylase
MTRPRVIEAEWPTLPAKYRLMFVGECPGYHETQSGRCFIGEAGQRFDNLLSVSGIVRASHLVTNVFHRRPAYDRIEEFFTKPAVDCPFLRFNNIYNGMGLHPELFDEIPRLIGEIACWQPHAIIALGGTATWALTGKEVVSKQRGKWHRCSLPELSHRIVIPTWHPSYVMRNEGSAKHKQIWQEMLDDIKLAKQMAVDYDNYR